MSTLRLRLSQNYGLLIAIGLLFVVYGAYLHMHPRGGSSAVFVQNINEAFALILVAMAQTVPVLIGGLDLSVGAMMTLVNCVASATVAGSAGQIVLGIVLCLAVGTLGGFINGCIVVYGRLQPIIVTLATGGMFLGGALFIRPTPGGQVDGDLSFAATFDINEAVATYGGAMPGWFESSIGLVPVPMILLLLVVACVWLPFRRSTLGRGCYAVGSAEGAAYMSGVPVGRAKIAAFTLAGFFAAVGGLYLALQTGSGSADVPQAGAYTLNSIAAVVIGGTSLYGGSGGAVGSIFGAMVLRAISFIFRVIDSEGMLSFLADPLLQPLFEGCVLLFAVALGASRVLRVKNRLRLLG